MSILHITTIEQYKKITREHNKVVIKFGATWCGPCRAIAPDYERFSKDPKYKQITFVEVDIDNAEALANTLSISSVPAFYAIRNNEVVGNMSGATKDKLAKFLNII